MVLGKGHLCFLACGYPVFPAPFIERAVLSPLNGLGTLVENQWTVNVRIYFCTLFCSIALYVCTRVLIPVALLEILKSGNGSPPALFFFQTVLYSGFLAFPCSS